MEAGRAKPGGILFLGGDGDCKALVKMWDFGFRLENAVLG